jgi:two-component system LytT family response regulator
VQQPDLIFLDMEMPGQLGMELLSDLPEKTQVVFVTAYAEYAVQAFEAGALDYLVKPVDPERLERTLERFLTRQVDRESSIPPQNHEEVLLSSHLQNQQSQIIRLKSIHWIEGMQNYTRVKVIGKETLVIFRRRLADWEALLSDESYHRIGRSHIINLSTLRRTKWISRDVSELYFEGNPEPLVVGRSASAHLKELLQNG